MKVLLIQNPAAGHKKRGKPIRALLDALQREGAKVTVKTTNAAGDGEAIARAAGAAYDVIACAGGDGTLHEIVSGVLKGASAVTPLGFIPFGTTNDVAHSLGLPRRPADVGRLLLQGKHAPMDVGRFNGRHFVYTASFGTFSDIAYTTPRARKQRWGKLAYVFTGAAQMGRLRTQHATIDHDGGTETGEWALVAVTNARRIGGGFIRYRPEEAQLDDGMFELMMVKKPPGFLRMLWVLAKMALRLQDARYLRCVQTSRVRVTAAEPIPWCLDGENGGAWQDAAIAVLPRCIEVIHGERVEAFPAANMDAAMQGQ